MLISTSVTRSSITGQCPAGTACSVNSCSRCVIIYRTRQPDASLETRAIMTGPRCAAENRESDSETSPPCQSCRELKRLVCRSESEQRRLVAESRASCSVYGNIIALAGD
nr:hypothetical protein CFP56_31624 [Quercus suber]